MFWIGRTLQVVGLIVAPLGLIYGGMEEAPGAVGRELTILGAGTAIFLLGVLCLRSGGK